MTYHDACQPPLLFMLAPRLAVRGVVYAIMESYVYLRMRTVLTGYLSMLLVAYAHDCDIKHTLTM